MKIQSILCLLVLFLSLWGCDFSPKEPQKLSSDQATLDEKHTKSDSANLPIAELDQIAWLPETNKRIRALEKVYDKVLYLFFHEADTFFVVVKGEWSDFPCESCLVGLVNQTYKVLIPVAYDKLYNPGATALGYIEVERSGKRGLYDLKGKEVLKAEYEGIYPVKMPGAIVQVQQGDRFGWLGEDGTVHMEKSHRPMLHVSPLASQQIKSWRYDVSAEGLIPFFSPYTDESRREDSTGILILPSYLTKIMKGPQKIEHLSSTPSDSDLLRVYSSASSVSSFRKISREIWALFSLYQESGINAREYQTEFNHVATLRGNDMSIVDQASILNNSEEYGLCEGGDYRMLNDTLLQVFSNAHMTQSGLPYDQQSHYSFYRISPQGAIDSLVSPRIFDFTKFIKINPEYFKGCFAEPMKKPDADGNYLVYQHLSMDDLDLMRNEIFAEYGYTFQTDRWREHFNQQAWYQPRHNDVDRFLTEVDKYNIQVILQVQEEMKGKEASFRKAEKLTWAPPG